MEIYEEGEMQYGGDLLQSSSNKLAYTAPTIAIVDDAHPFDLEAYTSGYSGRSAIDRLIHIISHAPSLASQALKRSLELLVEPNQRDVSLFQSILAAYTHTSETHSTDVPPFEALIPDQMPYFRWMEATSERNTEERTKLEVELKTYTNNMIKESIRLAHRDLAAFHRACGSFESSLRHYTKSREFSTTPAHMLEMCLSVLELLIEHRNYAHITTYVFKAESALDAAMAQASSGGNSGGGSTAKRNDAFKPTESKLSLSSALSLFHTRSYAKAAPKFLVPGTSSAWAGSLLHPGDSGIYGTLCALATMERAEVKRRYAAGDSALGEGEGMKDLVDAWLGSRFKNVIQLLDKHSTRFALDPLLAPHLTALTQALRSRALTLYFQPFSTIRLERMSAAFGWTLDETEREVVALIRRGEIAGRVDSSNKVLRARQRDERTVVYDRALRRGQEMERATERLLLRMRLQQADLVVRKAPVPAQE
ncbi:26S proteasome subunit RPN7-domain-containing protein [Vararia minispora EC-137]|uniref:26S proteasome subunit RPN7-domain-containing protein n=1 Tax=Vararia minispora EC-137 TaxID=1314806 RepID=A0ACB8QMD2_9AGAM|nr:26S proteasome subunit RPN7-domain-containing protein [Vararia minispora EC-137]